MCKCITLFISALIGFLLCIVCASTVFASYIEEVDPEVIAGESVWKWNIDGGIQHRLNTETDSGAEFNVTSGKLSLGVKRPFSDQLNLDIYSSFIHDTYNFSGAGISDEAPWEDTNYVRMRALLNYLLTPQWVISGGGIFASAYEKDAKEDNDYGGGILGFMHVRHPDMVFGAAFVVMSQEKADTLFIPIPIVRWGFAESWLFKTGVTDLATDYGAGFEIEKSFSPVWTVSAGAQIQKNQMQNKRFRLDDEGFAPNGFVLDENIPVYLRATWQFKQNIVIELIGSVYFDGELTIEDENGETILSEDYDPSPMVGLHATCDF